MNPTHQDSHLIQADLKRIVPSKTNPRKSFNAQEEKELLESVRSRGIVNPLLLRFLPDEMAEIVDGERRYRAAKTLGLQTVPGIILNYTDDEAYEVQLISFAQRVDIHPLDEADAYEQLRKKKFDIAQIAAKVGKERSYIAKRLQLVALIEPAKKQLREGRISLGHAIEIARVQPEGQKEALDEIDYNAATVSELREWIQEMLLQDLGSAPFKKDDAALVPKAGPCTACPKRSSSNPDLFGDISKKGERCLDAKCFDAKMEAFRELKKAKEKGRAEGDGTDGSTGKAPVSMARRQELYKRRLEIFNNRIEQEARQLQYGQIVKRIKWPLDRRDFELIIHELTKESKFDFGELAKLIGVNESEFIGETDRELKEYAKYTDQQLAQFAIGALLYQELIQIPLMAQEEDTRLERLCSHHGVDRKKIRDEVAKEMEAKKPKSPKIEPPAKPKITKSVKKKASKGKGKK